MMQAEKRKHREVLRHQREREQAAQVKAEMGEDGYEAEKKKFAHEDYKRRDT